MNWPDLSYLLTCQLLFIWIDRTRRWLAGLNPLCNVSVEELKITADNSQEATEKIILQYTLTNQLNQPMPLNYMMVKLNYSCLSSFDVVLIKLTDKFYTVKRAVFKEYACEPEGQGETSSWD